MSFPHIIMTKPDVIQNHDLKKYSSIVIGKESIHSFK